MKELVNAVEFYYTATKLKDLIRQGGIEWKVNKKHMESVADHTFGCLMLAFGLQNEMSLKLDFDKITKILALHELEEVYIGDLTVFDNVTKEEKLRLGKEATNKILNKLSNPSGIKLLIDEFNECKTEESKFCKAIDKLECVLEFKKYVDKGLTDWEKCPPHIMKNDFVKYLYDRKDKYNLSDAFYMFHKGAFEYLGFTEKVWLNFIKPIIIN